MRWGSAKSSWQCALLFLGVPLLVAVAVAVSVAAADDRIGGTPRDASRTSARHFWRQFSDRRDLRLLPRQPASHDDSQAARVAQRQTSEGETEEDWLISPDARGRAESFRDSVPSRGDLLSGDGDPAAAEVLRSTPPRSSEEDGEWWSRPPQSQPRLKTPADRQRLESPDADDDSEDWLVPPTGNPNASSRPRPIPEATHDADDLLVPRPVVPEASLRPDAGPPREMEIPLDRGAPRAPELLSPQPARLPRPGTVERRVPTDASHDSRTPDDSDDSLLIPPPSAASDEEDLLLPPPAADVLPRSVPETHLHSTPPSDSGAGDSASDASGDSSESSAAENELDPHWELFSKNAYPSAKECATCHEKIYEEWSVSSHAYAAISPMFQKFEQKINELSQGTVGYFCLRCHAPVATDMGVPRDANIWNTIPAAQEGVTCIACHRVVERYGRANGERRIEHGSIFAPVVGGGNGQKVHEVIEKKDYYKVKTSPDEKGPGTPIHTGVIQFDHVSSSHFCVSCHQVAVFPGIKLEVVWEQYRASPACKSGIRCQDCHMGAVPGQAAGFETAPAAIVNGKKINPDRRHSNHMFVGPGYSIAHPGTFPFHLKGDRWSIDEWLQFDWRAGWGTDDFEDNLSDEAKKCFPKVWENVDDRYDARDIIDDNLKLLDVKRTQRSILMEGSSKVLGPYFPRPPRRGEALKFHYRVTNLNSGHNMPSGSLGAQPQIWLNVVLTGPHGQWLWESGYVDANGDMADMHSLEVAAGRIKRDTQLFNLQTKFLTTGVKGTDREMYLPINVDIDQLPFLRPSGFPITTLNHPPFIRMEAHSLTPLGTRKASYHVPAELMRQPGRYRLSVRMRSRAEPIYFMRFCGATPEMERQMNEGMLNFHQESFEFLVR